MATATLKRTYEDAIDAAGPYFENEQPARLEPKRKKKKDLPTEPQLEKTSNQQVKVIPPPEDIAIQIVAGSYDRVLHGITVTIPLRLLDPASNVTANGSQPDEVLFTDTFLLAPHTSSIRCLALSPPTENHKRFLATGSTDERINLFSLSTLRSSPTRKPLKPKPKSLTGNITSENPLNRPLGSLTHHTRPLTTLSFPTKTKLFSAAEDSTISITRTRDWNLLSTISAPRPAQTGRPSGDTAAPGEVPSGINDFAIHPSQKLMLSVGKGEKCLRLWNLMTGRKAGVLNFEREVLAEVGEGRHGKGEGRSVLWGREGEVFVVGFERGFVVFGVDCKVRAVVKVGTKLHRMRFLPSQDILAISTEDGRVVFYDLTPTTSEQSETADPSTAVPCVRRTRWPRSRHDGPHQGLRGSQSASLRPAAHTTAPARHGE